jgi:Beta-propeller repeat
MKSIPVRKLIISSLVLFAVSLAACNQTPDAVSTIPANADDLVSAGPTRGQLKARDFGTATYDYGRGVAANATGVYVVGSTDGSLDGPNKGSSDAFIRKYDGGVVWAQQFGTRAYDVATDVVVDTAGNSYVAGETNGALGFKVGNRDVFLRKYNGSGAVIWTRQFGTAAYDDDAIDVALDASGNSFVLSRDLYTGFVVRKFGPTGVLYVTKTFPMNTLPGIYPDALAIDSLGNVIVVADWYGGAISGENVRVFKFTNALADVWSVPYQTNFDDYSYDVATLGTDIYITAKINTPSTTYFGARYVKFNAAGSVLLTRQLEPTPTCNCTILQSITVDASGNVYVMGYTDGSFAGFTNAGNYDIVAFKYNAAGTKQWVRQLGAGTNGTILSDIGYAVAVSDAVYVVGYSYENLLGDPKYGAGDTDAYLLQLDKITGNIIGIDQ